MKKIAAIIIVLLITGSQSYSQFGLDKLKEAVQQNTNISTETASEAVNSTTSDGKIGEKNSDGTVTDFGMTSPLHEKYKGQVVFSRNSPRSGTLEESSIANKFVLKPNEYIHYFAMFDKSCYNQAIKDGQKWIATRQKDYSVFLRVYYEVNGKTIGKDDFNQYSAPLMDEEWRTFTTFNSGQRSVINCALGDREHPGLSLVSYGFPLLKKGENKIKVLVTFELRHPETDELYTPAKPMASGEFTLVLNNENDIPKTIMERGLLVKSEMDDEQIENEIKKLYKGPGKIEKIIFKENDWVIDRDQYDVIKSKYLSLILVTLEDGKHIAGYAGLQAKYQGGGGYGKNVLDVSEKRWEIPDFLVK